MQDQLIDRLQSPGLDVSEDMGRRAAISALILDGESLVARSAASENSEGEEDEEDSSLSSSLDQSC